MPIREEVTRILAAVLSVVSGAIVLIAAVLTGRLDTVVEQLRAAYERFYACLLMSIAACGFIMWLVPDTFAKHGLCVVALTLGIVSGVLWERRT